MAVRGKRLTDEIIADVLPIVRTKLKPETAEVAEAFIRRFYANVPPSDLIGVDSETLYSAALSIWRFAAERAPGQTLVRVFNPSLSDDGWQSPHTIVEVVNDDMPF